MRTGRLREAEGPLRPHIQEGQMTEQLFARSLEVPAAGTAGRDSEPFSEEVH